MDIITLDFETYFDQDYSLSKMTTEAYVRDPRFGAHGVAIRWPDGNACWYSASDVPLFKPMLNAAAVLCHHAQFDGLILAHHYGIKPALWLDTLSMSRLLLGTHVSHSLDGLRAHMGLPAKTTPYNLFKGRHWTALTPEAQKLVADGACDEVQSIWQIFNWFMKGDY